MEHLLHLVAPLIAMKNTKFRDAISPADSLMVTIRYLASGNSQVLLSYLFRMGRKTISQIVSETSRAIHIALKDPYFSPEVVQNNGNRFRSNLVNNGSFHT